MLLTLTARCYRCQRVTDVPSLLAKHLPYCCFNSTHSAVVCSKEYKNVMRLFEIFVESNALMTFCKKYRKKQSECNACFAFQYLIAHLRRVVRSGSNTTVDSPPGSHDSKPTLYAKYCLRHIASPRTQTRKFPPSNAEIEVTRITPIVCELPPTTNNIFNGVSDA